MLSNITSNLHGRDRAYTCQSAFSQCFAPIWYLMTLHICLGQRPVAITYKCIQILHHSFPSFSQTLWSVYRKRA